ncbi:MAG: hypothetical protein BV457_05865 [Thermoplasmata archaeon M9B1D]|nr:MAG: hypothetical protein BV457_05865 [Thermoplasmata archaeon M9B1D]PNX51237.1 MAG: hypothetical protein BV456_04020 [Thermoplasmata archaeon M8B2D]
MKTYILVHDQNSTTFGYWYGWYDGKKAKWSCWKDSIKNALNAELEDDEEEAETLEEYKKTLSKNTVILYESAEPIDFEIFQREYPEYLV